MSDFNEALYFGPSAVPHSLGSKARTRNFVIDTDCACDTEAMGKQFTELPDWEFNVREFSPGFYQVTAVRNGGITGEAKGVDPDAALAELRAWAQSVDQNLYRAIVWIDDLPGSRVTVHANSPSSAIEKLKAQYGDEAVISLSNGEDAECPRDLPN